VRLALASLWLLLLALACGKYGPPVRAGEVEPKKPAAKFEVPLPQPGIAPPEAAPGPEAEPAAEEEPPPEGAP